MSFKLLVWKAARKVRQYKCTKLTKIVVTVAAKNVARIAYFSKKMAHPHFENVRVCVMNTIYMIKSENPLRKTMNWCLVRSSPWTRLPDTTSYKPILLSTTSMITNVWYVFGYVFWYSTPFYPKIWRLTTFFHSNAAAWSHHSSNLARKSWVDDSSPAWRSNRRRVPLVSTRTCKLRIRVSTFYRQFHQTVLRIVTLCKVKQCLSYIMRV